MGFVSLRFFRKLSQNGKGSSVGFFVLKPKNVRMVLRSLQFIINIKSFDFCVDSRASVIIFISMFIHKWCIELFVSVNIFCVSNQRKFGNGCGNRYVKRLETKTISSSHEQEVITPIKLDDNGDANFLFPLSKFGKKLIKDDKIMHGPFDSLPHVVREAVMGARDHDDTNSVSKSTDL